MSNNLRIAITLPYHFVVRDFLFTPVWEEMAKRQDVQFLFLHNDPQAVKLISERGCPNIMTAAYPARDQSLPKSILRRDFPARLWMAAFRRFDERYLYDSLTYRFVAVNNLSHYRIRKGKSPEERKRHQVSFDEYRKGEMAGRPFPKSKTLFRFLYDLRYGFLNIARRDDMVFLQHLKPDLFVFGRLQWPTNVYWTKALRRLRIPMVGIVSSWDHPTTKGPVLRGMSGYIVASRRMVDEMANLHGIDRGKICQTGKVQMDIYKKPTTFISREDFLKRMGIPSEHRLITFGTNATGLKEHEVSIARKLSTDFAEGRYGKATLLLRTHPQDTNWRRDFLAPAKPPWVLCINAASFGGRKGDSLADSKDDSVMLANLMKHSDIVIQSRGSLALDAIAFDTPVISLAFDGDMERAPNDSFLLEYGYEHYKPLVRAEGTWMVGSYQELDRAIRGYLSDPSIHSEGRKRIREEHIEPLDGKSSQRLVDYLVESAKQARDGTLPEGDWNLTGLGDTTWASRQICDVNEYVQEIDVQSHNKLSNGGSEMKALLEES